MFCTKNHVHICIYVRTSTYMKYEQVHKCKTQYLRIIFSQNSLIRGRRNSRNNFLFASYPQRIINIYSCLNEEEKKVQNSNKGHLQFRPCMTPFIFPFRLRLLRQIYQSSISVCAFFFFFLLVDMLTQQNLMNESTNEKPYSIVPTKFNDVFTPNIYSMVKWKNFVFLLLFISLVFLVIIIYFFFLILTSIVLC